LLLTLLVVSLLLSVILSFVVFVRIELRSAQNRQELFSARANARLALGIAIGQLQAQAGPDARVTARADLVAPDAPAGAENWIGVFKSSFSVEASNRRITENADNGAFAGWLVSGGEVLNNPQLTNADLNAFPEILDIVPEFSEGGLTRQAVRVPLRNAGSAPTAGTYGFWVSDESQKLYLNGADRTDEVRHNATTYQEREWHNNSMGENYSDSSYIHPEGPAGTGLVPGNGFNERERLRQLARQTPSTGILLNRAAPGADPAILAPNAERGAFMSGNNILLHRANFGNLFLHDATVDARSVLTNVPEGRLKYDLSDVAAIHTKDSYINSIFGPNAVRISNDLKGTVSDLLKSRHTPNKPVRHQYSKVRDDAGFNENDVHGAVTNKESPYITEFAARFMVYVGDEFGNRVGDSPESGKKYYVCVGAELEWEIWNPWRMDVSFISDNTLRLGGAGWPQIEVSLSNGTVAHPTVQLDHLLFHSMENPYASSRSSLNPALNPALDPDADEQPGTRYKSFIPGGDDYKVMKPGEILVLGTPGIIYKAPSGIDMWQKNSSENSYGTPILTAITGNDGHRIYLVPGAPANMMTFVLTDNEVTFTGATTGDITVSMDSFHTPSLIREDFPPNYRGAYDSDDLEKDIFTLYAMSPGNQRDKAHNYQQTLHPPGRFSSSTETYAAGDDVLILMRWGFGWSLRDDPMFFLQKYNFRKSAWNEPENDEMEFRTPLDDGLSSRKWKSDLGTNADNKIPPSAESTQIFSATSRNTLGGLAFFEAARQEPLTLSVLKPLIHAGVLDGSAPRPFYFGHPWGGDNNRPWDSAFFSTLPRGIDEFQPTLEDIRLGKLPNTLMAPAFDTETLPAPQIGFSGVRTSPGNEINWSTVTGMMRFDIASLYLMQSAGFNINSTSVQAWEGLLAGGRFRVEPDGADGAPGADRRWRIHGAGGSNPVADDLKNLHFTLPQLADYTSEYLPEAEILSLSRPASERSAASQEFQRRVVFHQGARALTDAQVTEMARKLVDKMKTHVRTTRGGKPFTSVREFVNAGLLDQLLDPQQEELSDPPNEAFYTSPDENYRYAPAYLSQADILGNVSHFLTPRGDTFLIRVYGDTRNAAGAVVARAHAEAVVQRVPDPVEPLANASPSDTELHDQANKLDPVEHPFGRRFRVVSFKWLEPESL
jgi:hypothetical protein